MIAVIGSLYKEVKDLLPHFYKHYSEWGVDEFHFGVYGGQSNPIWNETLELGKGLNVKLYNIESMELDAHREGDFKNRVRKSLKDDDWFIPIDLDEFHVVEGYTSFKQAQKDCESQGAEFIWSALRDRIKQDGTIPITIDSNESIWKQFPRNHNVSDIICKAWCRKICMAKQNVLITGGHHAPIGDFKRFSKEGLTYHFKWFGPIYEKMKERYELHLSQKRDYAEEQKRLLNFLDTHGGKLL